MGRGGNKNPALVSPKIGETGTGHSAIDLFLDFLSLRGELPQVVERSVGPVVVQADAAEEIEVAGRIR